MTRAKDIVNKNAGMKQRELGTVYIKVRIKLYYYLNCFTPFMFFFIDLRFDIIGEEQ